MNKLNKIYKAILEALGCKIKKDFSLVMVNAGKEYEIKVDDKRTFLPTNDAMNVVDLDRAFFHPACESITSKETEIDKVLRKLVTSSIYFNFKPIAGVLLKVANKGNKNLNNKYVELFKPLKDVPKNIMTEITDLASRISIQTEYEGVDTRIVSYTLMRGGKTNEDEHIYYRCVPAFPFYNELTRVINQNSGKGDESTVIFNDSQYKMLTLRVMQAIFEITLPVVNDPSRGEAIALNPVAARMTALLRCFSYIANDINSVIGKFRKDFDEIGVYGIDTTWVEKLDDLPDLAGIIPPLDYNSYNTNGKPHDDTQDQQYNLFNVASEQNNYNGYNNNNYQNNNNGNSPNSPTPPPKLENEIYRGMTQLANGLYEYRFQNGQSIRVVCTNAQGHKITEQFENLNGSPQQNNWGNGMGWGNYGQPMFPNYNGMQQSGMQVVSLPNGTFVPFFNTMPNNSDPYNQGIDYNQNNNTGFQQSNQMTGVPGNF